DPLPPALPCWETTQPLRLLARRPGFSRCELRYRIGALRDGRSLRRARAVSDRCLRALSGPSAAAVPTERSICACARAPRECQRARGIPASALSIQTGYLTLSPLCTPSTPLTLLASFSASSFSAVEATVPSNMTTPSLVVTWMSVALVPLSFASSAFTLVVMYESLTGWSLLTSSADALPMRSASEPAAMSVDTYLLCMVHERSEERRVG